MVLTRPPSWNHLLHGLYLFLLGVLFAVPLVTARAAAVDTCNGITLKCSTPKTGVAGGKIKAQLVLSGQGHGEPINEIGLVWDGTQLFYAEPKQSAFGGKGTSPPIISDSRVSWYGAATNKAKFRATYDVDPCAQPTQYLSAYASVGGCDLRVDCHPIQLKYRRKKHPCTSGQTLLTLVTSVNNSNTVICGSNRQCIAPEFRALGNISATLSQSATPWTNTATNIMTLSLIPYVVGSNSAYKITPAGSVFAMSTDKTYRYLKGNGLPRTFMGDFPVQPGTAAYPYYAALPGGTDPTTGQAYQPNGTADEIYIAPYNLTSTLPLHPVPTGYHPINSLIVGITLTGGVIHAEVAADSNNNWYNPTNVLPLDQCWGHPYRNQYHHHAYSWKCFPNQGTSGHSPLLAYALDGFGIYGPRDEDGEIITNAQLDECHGHVGPVMWNGKKTVMYHYHLNREYPFSVGCFRGDVDYYKALGSTDMRQTNLPIYGAGMRALQATGGGQQHGLAGRATDDAVQGGIWSW